jgi:hypothetical protein
MSKKNELNYTHIGMLVIIGLAMVAVGGIYVTLDDQKELFANTGKRLEIIYPDNTKFGFQELDVELNFSYQSYQGLNPKFFHEYTVSFPQIYDGDESYTMIIKFLVESALVTGIDIILTMNQNSSSQFKVDASFKTSPIYYDALNTPLQDVYVVIWGLPDV